MRKIRPQYGAELLLGLFLISPLAAKAAIQYNGTLTAGSEVDNHMTVSVSLGRIKDIDGCNPSNCKYWQIHVQEAIGNWGRYYSSDVYPASQLSALYTFHLPAGTYSGVLLAGYKSSATGFCDFIIPGDSSDSCPDGKHIMSDTNGLVYITDQEPVSYPPIIQNVSTPTPLMEAATISATTAIPVLAGITPPPIATIAPEIIIPLDVAASSTQNLKPSGSIIETVMSTVQDLLSGSTTPQAIEDQPAPVPVPESASSTSMPTIDAAASTATGTDVIAGAAGILFAKLSLLSKLPRILLKLLLLPKILLGLF